MFDGKEHSHTRYDILTGDWIMVSPHRTKRPWQGKVESLPEDNRPAYDPACYLCPGNRKKDGFVVTFSWFARCAIGTYYR